MGEKCAKTGQRVARLEELAEKRADQGTIDPRG